MGITCCKPKNVRDSKMEMKEMKVVKVEDDLRGEIKREKEKATQAYNDRLRKKKKKGKNVY